MNGCPRCQQSVSGQQRVGRNACPNCGEGLYPCPGPSSCETPVVWDCTDEKCEAKPWSCRNHHRTYGRKGGTWHHHRKEIKANEASSGQS